MDYIDTREGWREVDLSDEFVSFAGDRFAAVLGGRTRYWIREQVA